MLDYAVVFFVIAMITALFGFGGIAAIAADIAKIISSSPPLLRWPTSSSDGPKNSSGPRATPFARVQPSNRKELS